MRITLEICGFKKEMDVSNGIYGNGVVEIALLPPLTDVLPPSSRMGTVMFFRGYKDDGIWRPRY